MEKKHRCKLCFRNFANGRALGGHMRSHMMKFYAEEKASKLENGEDEQPVPFHHHFQSLHSYSSASLPSSSSSSSSEEEEYDEEEREVARGASSYELRENPRKSAVLVDHDFSSVVDRESETESSKNKKKKSICRRSKRVRKSRVSDLDMFLVKKTKFEDEGKGNINEQSSPLSSISDTTPEEHVAHCLIMLSRDKWEKEEREYVQEEEDDEEDICQDSGVAKMIIKNKFRGKYRCEACNKLFRSYQALGGHRASHKKIKAAPAEKNGGSKAVAAAAEAKIHQCPFCDRIFSSGQALGGHKRSHFVGANAISTNCSTIISQNSRIAQVLNIDLNLPAPVDDDESSQIAISAVSDAEFVHPPLSNDD